MKFKKTKSYLVNPKKEEIITNLEFETNKEAFRFVSERGIKGFSGHKGKYLNKKEFDNFKEVKFIEYTIKRDLK